MVETTENARKCARCGKAIGEITYIKRTNDVLDKVWQEEEWCNECGLNDEPAERDMASEMAKYFGKKKEPGLDDFA